MKKKLAVLLFAVPMAANAAPFIVSDAPAAGITPTHCGLYFDASTSPVLSPVDSTLACRHDIGGIGVGPHTARATFIIQDPLWGNQEGPKSAQLAFTRPAPLTVSPVSVRLAP